MQVLSSKYRTDSHAESSIARFNWIQWCLHKALLAVWYAGRGCACSRDGKRKRKTIVSLAGSKKPTTKDKYSTWTSMPDALCWSLTGCDENGEEDDLNK